MLPMQLMLVATTAAMPYPEEVPVFTEAVPPDAAPLAKGETVDERSRHHHYNRPSYGSQGI